MNMNKVISWNQSSWKAKSEWVFEQSPCLYVNVYRGLEHQRKGVFLKKGMGVIFESGVQKGSILCPARGNAMADNQ